MVMCRVHPFRKKKIKYFPIQAGQFFGRTQSYFCLPDM